MTKFFYECEKCGNKFSHFISSAGLHNQSVVPPDEECKKKHRVKPCPKCKAKIKFYEFLPKTNNTLVRVSIDSGPYRGKYTERM